MATPRLEDLPHYGYQDYLQWEGRWELIAGIPYAMTPAPSVRHQSISGRIDRLLQEALEECQGCRALLPVDWKIDEDTVVQPDNLVIRHEPQHAYLTRAPVLIFEVLSPNTARKDKITKFALYEREGVRHYVIVDPDEKVAKVYRRHQGRYIKVTDAVEERCAFDLGDCSIELDFSRIWN